MGCWYILVMNGIRAWPIMSGARLRPLAHSMFHLRTCSRCGWFSLPTLCFLAHNAHVRRVALPRRHSSKIRSGQRGYLSFSKTDRNCSCFSFRLLRFSETLISSHSLLWIFFVFSQCVCIRRLGPAERAKTVFSIFPLVLWLRRSFFAFNATRGEPYYGFAWLGNHRRTPCSRLALYPIRGCRRADHASC